MSTAVQRGEAHLWLLLEEALVAVGRGGADPWDVQRHFRYVADAMSLSGVVPRAIARTLRLELDDALAVRRLVPAATFLADEQPIDDEARAAHRGPADGALVWFEAEIERHLDLLAAHDPAVRPDAGGETLRILAAPARAFDAAGVFGAEGKGLVADLTASIADAGFDPGRATPGDGRVRRDWVRFLRDRPPPFPDPFEPGKSVQPRAILGTIGDRTVRVDEVAWTEGALELRVALRGTDGFTVDVLEQPPWCARVLDHRGRVHLGQPSRSSDQGGTATTFRLRPGLEDGVSVLQVRISSRGWKVEGQVAL